MKKLLSILVTVIMACPAIAADVAVDSCTNSEPAACTNCDTTAHTVAADANYLIVSVNADSDLLASVFTGATWDQGGTNQAMTEVEDNNGVGGIAAKTFVLANPTTGNKTLRVTTSSTSGMIDISVCSFKNVNTATPYGTIVETEHSGTPNTSGDSLAFTLGSGGLAYAYLANGTTWAGFAQGASQTERTRNTTSCNSDCETIQTTATVSPMDYTWNSTSRYFWHVVIPLNAASGRRPISPIIFP